MIVEIYWCFLNQQGFLKLYILQGIQVSTSYWMTNGHEKEKESNLSWTRPSFKYLDEIL